MGAQYNLRRRRIGFAGDQGGSGTERQPQQQPADMRRISHRARAEQFGKADDAQQQPHDHHRHHRGGHMQRRITAVFRR